MTQTANISTATGGTLSGTFNYSGTLAMDAWAGNGSGTISGSGTVNGVSGSCAGGFTMMIPPSVTALAGSFNRPGSADGTGVAASFYGPADLAVDGTGNVFVADSGNNSIRKITSAGVVTTLAGGGSAGSANGTGAAASFNLPYGVAVDASGTVYVADTYNNLIRKVTPAGVVTTLAGSGNAGSANGTGTAASFNFPFGVAVDTSGNVYVAENKGNLIRKITSSGVVTTLAGSGSAGSANGTGTAASFSAPQGVAVDAAGNVYVTDGNNNLIRKITSAGVVTTLAGSGGRGSADGTGTAASFDDPWTIAVSASGNVFVLDFGTAMIREITSAGVVTTLPKSSKVVYGVGTTNGLAIDSSGNLYMNNYDLILKYSPL